MKPAFLMLAWGKFLALYVERQNRQLIHFELQLGYIDV